MRAKIGQVASITAPACCLAFGARVQNRGLSVDPKNWKAVDCSKQESSKRRDDEGSNAVIDAMMRSRGEMKRLMHVLGTLVLPITKGLATMNSARITTLHRILSSGHTQELGPEGSTLQSLEQQNIAELALSFVLTQYCPHVRPIARSISNSAARTFSSS